MANNSNTFETIIRLNAQEAKNEMEALKRQLDELKRKKADALRDPGSTAKDVNKFNKEIKAAEASLKAYGASVSKTIDTINNLSTASLGDIEKAAREVRRAMKQVTKQDDYHALNQVLQRCKDRIDELKDSTVQSKREMQELNNASTNLQRVLGNINGASMNELTAAAETLQKEIADIKPDTDAFRVASENLQHIKARIQEVSEAQKVANIAINKYDQEMAAARHSAADLARENKLIDATLKNISGASLRDLQYSLKIVNERLLDTKQGTKAFDALNNKAKQLKAQIEAVNNEQRESTLLFSRVTNAMNNNIGVITQVVASITGLSYTIRQCVNAFTEMDQEMNNVRKYTGQTMEEVVEMNEDFKKMDTRTSRQQLNMLAESAGRLGITSKDQIEEFIDAADKIGVALGDDLGKGAIDKVGKLAMAFGEDDRLGLRGAMLATGSAINELAQNSSASAGYLVEFTARVAGVGKQVGLTQAQIMGFAAVLDENMQKDEMAATAFSQLLTKMSVDTKTFAKMAGMDLKSFSNLVKTDINQAVMAGTRQISLATAAQELWNNVIKANPYAAALTAMIAVTTAIIAFSKRVDEATRKQIELNKANAEAAANCRSEISELSTLVSLVRDKSASDGARHEALKKLQNLYPEYLQSLTMENINSVEARKAVDNLTDSILSQAKARVYLSKVEELERKKQDVNEEYMNSWWGSMVQNWRAQFQALGNNIAHYGEKVKNALSMGFDGGQFGSGLRGFSVGWQQKTTIEKEGYSRNDITNYIRNRYADIQAIQKQQDEWLAKYKAEMAAENERLHEARKASEALAKGDGNNGLLDNGLGEYKSEAERKEEAAAERKAAIAARKAEAEKKRQEALKAKNLREAVKAQKAITSAELVEIYRRYKDEDLAYRDYLKMQYDARQKGLDAQIAMYGEESNEAAELIRKKTELEKQYVDDMQRINERELEMKYASRAVDLQMAYEKEGLNEGLYHNEIELYERMYDNDIDYLKKKQSLYTKGSQEWLDIDEEIKQRQHEHELKSEQRYQDLLSRYREQWARADNAEQERIALLGLEALHKKGLISEKEYQEMLRTIRQHYAEMKANDEMYNSKGEVFKRNAHNAYNTASTQAQASVSDKHEKGVNVGAYLTGDLDIYRSTLINIKSMEKEGVISHEEAMAAMGEATAAMCEGLVAKMQAAMDAISPLMSNLSSYYAAQSDYEVTVTEKKYEKLISAAGNNTAKAKKLEEKKEKEVAKIKTKYARKQASMQVAQAVAQTAMSAIAAYASAMSGVPYPANMVLAPIAAGIALAAGAIQIATIKKQQQAQEAGYYEGGFTGGRRYRRAAGVVHEGEFVANHNAVNNANILPALQLIDEAQRNNTVSTLTANDISRSLGQGGATVVSAPSVTVNNDNTELNATMADARDVIDRLSMILASGIDARVYIDGPQGVAKNLDDFRRLQART